MYIFFYISMIFSEFPAVISFIFPTILQKKKNSFRSISKQPLECYARPDENLCGHKSKLR